ncbi:MAG: hypothetical protein K5664_00340 [Firmicutes bacterium]|nr:hypothetical protein [Bacillota bacterium]
MEKLYVNFENCYGIKKLEHEFDFTKNHCCLIYASNGVMKTSFTKTFKALSVGKKPSDEVFKRTTNCKVVKDDDLEINKEDIFVISSYEDEYVSANTAKLIVNKSLKEQYNIELDKISAQKEQFVESVSEFMGDIEDLEMQFTKIFDRQPIDFLDCLSVLWKNFKDIDAFSLPFHKVSYTDVINDDVQKFISEPKNLEQINEYSTRYNELLAASPIFKRGIFSHYNAEELSSSLDSNGFFEAKHRLVFDGSASEIVSQEQYNSFIDQERNKIFSDEKLQKKFDKITKALSKKALQGFRRVIEIMPEIIPLLSDFEMLKKRIWISVYKNYEQEVSGLLKAYDASKDTVSKIKNAARAEKTQWSNVLEIFKERFAVPFTIEIPNIDEVLLNDSIPEFVFKYVDSDNNDEIAIERKSLEKVLSQGEKRALYLLNIIYDLEAIKLSGDSVLIVADDISDSFDYKNKYAIIEYLQEMALGTNMKFIILTHNFDFYRTTFHRIEKIRPYMVSRTNRGITLEDPKYLKYNPFALLKGGIKKNDYAEIITAIPFIRNIIEYISDNKTDEGYLKLTNLLHIKENTTSITLSELQDVFNSVLKFETPLSFSNSDPDRTVYSIIIDEAKQYILTNVDEISLEGKIILSIASRLIAEKFMISKIKETENGNDKVREIQQSGNYQTAKLFKEYKNSFPEELEAIKILNKVMLMTSENIHVNSFMFEPIIDMSSKSLVEIYGKLNVFVSGS